MRFLQDISKDIDLREIAEKYKLPLDEVKETVERSISDTLTDLLNSDVECMLTKEGSEIYIFRENEVEKIPIERLKKNIIRAIKYSLISDLSNEQAIRSYEELRFMAGGIAGGYVTKIFEDRIYVELAADGGSPVVGICEKRHQTPKERGLYRMGDYYNFYVSSVTPLIKGGVPEVKVFLSRTSKSLSEGLLNKELAEKLIDMRVRCMRRTAGVCSLMEAQERIPAECIKAVSDELKERIKVRVIREK
jgi:hypothetical protein